MIGHMLQHPLTRGRSVDDPWTTQLRRQIIASKPFLRSIYREWYALILDALGERQRVLELGSGAGFFKEVCPGAMTSEILLTPGSILSPMLVPCPSPTVRLMPSR